MKHYQLFSGKNTIPFFLLSSVLSAVLLFFSFPPFNIFGFVWIAFIPLYLFHFKYQGFVRGFLLYSLTGVIFFGTTLYWLNSFAFTAWLLTVLLLSITLGIAGGITGRIISPHTISLLPASIWAVYEIIRGAGRLGFPWLDLVYTQYRHPVMFQSAAIWGGMGVGFIVIAFNFFLAKCIYLKKIERKEYFVIGLFIFHILYGIFNVYEKNPDNIKPVKAALIQGNFPDKEDWEFYPERVKKNLLGMSRVAVNEFHPGIIVWTETVVLDALNRSPNLAGEFREFASKNNTVFLIGSPEVTGIKAYNSAYMITRGGISKVYRKQHLVPVGEKIPFVGMLPILKKWVPEYGTFDEGEKNIIFGYKEHQFNVLICFESFFSYIERDAVGKGSGFTINITNDVWSGSRTAHRQHFSAVPVRAVEYGRPFARAGNDGITALVDSKGRVVKKIPEGKPGILYAEIYPSGKKTIYFLLAPYLPFVLILFIILHAGAGLYLAPGK